MDVIVVVVYAVQNTHSKILFKTSFILWIQNMKDIIVFFQMVQ